MERTRTSLGVVAGTLLGGAFLLLPLVSAFTSTGCESADTTPAPDANAAPACNQGPFVFCSPLAEGDQSPSCSASETSSPILALLPKGARYPLGCKLNYVGTRDEQGDCILDSVCSCQVPDTAPAPTPAPVVDAGDEAGDAAVEAAAPPPPPPPPSTPGAPAWNCF